MGDPSDRPDGKHADPDDADLDDRDGDDEDQALENDDDSRGDMLPRAVRQKVEALIPEMVKKTFAAGMGAVFTTEEGIRRITKDMSLPKDVAGYLANTAGATKDEIMRIVAREVREFLQTVNLSEEIAKMLTTLSFEVKTEIRFIPNDERFGSVKPDVKAKVRLKKTEERTRRRRRRRRRRDHEETFDSERGSGGSGDGGDGGDE